MSEVRQIPDHARDDEPDHCPRCALVCRVVLLEHYAEATQQDQALKDKPWVTVYVVDEPDSGLTYWFRDPRD